MRTRRDRLICEYKFEKNCIKEVIEEAMTWARSGKGGRKARGRRRVRDGGSKLDHRSFC
jgi:hypothetical protein